MTPRTKAPASKSEQMRAVRSRGTDIEMKALAIVRSLRKGYRLSRRSLPGKPDISFGRLKLAIFVNGCFWHGHDCPRGSRRPKTNADYWRDKIARNRARDNVTARRLAALGWQSMIIWECEFAEGPALEARLRAALRAGE